MLKLCTNARELLVAPLVVGLVVALRVILASNTISEAPCVEQLSGGLGIVAFVGMYGLAAL